MADKGENILVEFDYDNITLIDPNKIIDNERKAYVPTPRDAMRANTIGNQLKQVNADIFIKSLTGRDAY